MDILNRWMKYEERFNAAVAGLDVSLETATRADLQEFRKLAGDITMVFNSISEEVEDLAVQVQNLVDMLADMRAERDWLFGMILRWLTEPVEYKSQILDKKVTETRFEIFQRAGAWEGFTFNEFAEDATGVKYKTWHAWVHAVEVWLTSDEGLEIMNRHGKTPEDFIRDVPMTKAIRASSAVGRGELRDDQAEVIFDVESTVSDVNKALYATPGEIVAEKEWKKEVEEQARLREQDFVENGNRKPVLRIEYRQNERELWLKGWLPGGKPIEKKVCGFSYPETPFEATLQEKIVQYVEDYVKSLAPATTDAKEEDALFLRLEVRAQKLEREGAWHD